MASDADFMDFIRLVISGPTDHVARRLGRAPALATTSGSAGATRRRASDFFFPEIRHYFYAGDTALHMAAAACRPAVVELLIAHGADGRARNRRGAQPLHYAADGHPAVPEKQAETITRLVAAGADHAAVDKSGVAPLHRAVRMRS